MVSAFFFLVNAQVALLAEGVDRNTKSFEEHGFVIGSPSSRRAWIEISLPEPPFPALPSPSSRRAWIEIIQIRPPKERGDVALLAEGVDRNFLPALPGRSHCVALLAEGVDRNILLPPHC